MENNIMDLAKVYRNNELFFWCNCLGDINLPGDTLNSFGKHKASELPKDVRDVYDHTNFGTGLCCYAVSLNGVAGYLINVLIDRCWMQDVLDKDDVAEESEALAKKMPGIIERIRANIAQSCAIPADQYYVLFGKETDPDGHELMFFVPAENNAVYRKMLSYLETRIYNVLRKELAKADS